MRMASLFSSLFCLLASVTVAVSSRDVVVLTSASFDTIVKDTTKTVFVKFFSPSCGHCKSMASAWEELATDMKGVPDVVIAELDAAKERDIADANGINGYPTMKLYLKHAKSKPRLRCPISSNASGRPTSLALTFATGSVQPRAMLTVVRDSPVRWAAQDEPSAAAPAKSSAPLRDEDGASPLLQTLLRTPHTVAG